MNNLEIFFKLIGLGLLFSLTLFLDLDKLIVYPMCIFFLFLFNPEKLSVKKIVQGFIIASLIILLVLLANIVSTATLPQGHSPNPVNFIYLSVLFFFGALFEEKLFRGFIFTEFSKLFQVFWSILLSSLWFALVHLFNPHISIIGFVNIFLAGVIFALLRSITNELSTNIGLHFGWNFSLGLIWGFPVSGYSISDALFTSQMPKPSWLFGGNFGPEAGILVSILFFIVLIFMTKRFINTTK